MESYFRLNDYPKWVRYTIAVSLQVNEFTGTIIFKPNVSSGRNMLDWALTVTGTWEYEPDMDIKENKRHILVNEEGYAEKYVLFDKEGNSFVLDKDDSDKHIVGVNTINYEVVEISET